MEDLEGEQDFEAYEQQQQKKEKEERELLDNNRKGDDDAYGDEYGSENGGGGSGDEDEEDEDIERGDGGYTSDPEMATAKRNYQFGGSAENEGGRRQRAQSAKPRNKSFNEGNLRSQKVTTQDYADRDGSKKKGKYGVTVPRPFNFDMREKTKKKTIREQKVEEMVAEKRNEEHAAYNF